MANALFTPAADPAPNQNNVIAVVMQQEANTNPVTQEGPDATCPAMIVTQSHRGYEFL